MLRDIGDIASKIWSSWSLLIGAALVCVLLSVLPVASFLDRDTLLIFNKYRGYIRVAALVFGVITFVRILIALAVASWSKISTWGKMRPRLKSLKKDQQITLLRLPYLESSKRELLHALVAKNQQRFTLPNEGNDNNWLTAYAEIVLAAMGFPYTEYKIKPWVWKYLKRNPSILDSKPSKEVKHESQE